MLPSFREYRLYIDERKEEMECKYLLENLVLTSIPASG